jgi:dihydrofolate reductase
MIADKDGLHPDTLKLEPDQQFFKESLDRADLVVHGRRSYETQANAAQRRRVILTHRVAGVETDPRNPNAQFWNPAGASFEEACAAAGRLAGTVAVVGGEDVFSLFLRIGYDAFYLSLAKRVRLPGGVPIFAEGRKGLAPSEVLCSAGLKPREIRHWNDEVSLVVWTP